MALADVVQEAQEPVNETYSDDSRGRLEQRLSVLRDKVCQQLRDQGMQGNDTSYEMYLNMRYQGTETSIMVLQPPNGDFKTEFKRAHLREFAFLFPDERPIFVDDVRVRGIGARGRQGPSDGNRLGKELRNSHCHKVSVDTAERMVRIVKALPNIMYLTATDKGVFSRDWQYSDPYLSPAQAVTQYRYTWTGNHY